MQRLRKHTDQKDASQRYNAELAARTVVNAEQAAWLNALDRAGELVLAGYYADARRVLATAIAAK